MLYKLPHCYKEHITTVVNHRHADQCLKRGILGLLDCFNTTTTTTTITITTVTWQSPPSGTAGHERWGNRRQRSHGGNPKNGCLLSWHSHTSVSLNALQKWRLKVNVWSGSRYRQTSNIRRTLIGSKLVGHSDVDGASPVGAAPTTSSFSI